MSAILTLYREWLDTREKASSPANGLELAHCYVRALDHEPRVPDEFRALLHMTLVHLDADPDDDGPANRAGRDVLRFLERTSEIQKIWTIPSDIC